MVEQSGEPFLLPFCCCFTHTAQSLGHAFPALYVRACGPRNLMKRIFSGGRIRTAGSGEADDTVDRLRPALCMVQRVPDGANNWASRSPRARTSIARARP